MHILETQGSGLPQVDASMLHLRNTVRLQWSGEILLEQFPWALYGWVRIPFWRVGSVYLTGWPPLRIEFPINMYDVRKPCDRSPDKDGPLCYKQLEWIPVWLNDKNVKNALGANPAITFNGSSEEVFQDFFTSGDLMHYSAGLLTDLVNDGIRLLVYAGETGETLRPSSLLVCSSFGRRCL